MGNGEAKLDVGFDFARVECAVEGAEFDGVRGPLGGKGRVQIQEVVAAGVVVGSGAPPPVLPAVPAVGTVPKLCQRLHGAGLAAVELGEEHRLHRLAPAPPSFRRDSQRLCQKVLLGVDDVHQPPQALRGVFAEADVDVNAAGGVGLRAGPAQSADHQLDHLDVLPAAHRADHLGGGVGDRPIALHRPLPPVGHRDLPVVKVPPDMAGCGSEERRKGAGCAFAAETGGFDLDAEGLVFHGDTLLSRVSGGLRARRSRRGRQGRRPPRRCSRQSVRRQGRGRPVRRRGRPSRRRPPRPRRRGRW